MSIFNHHGVPPTAAKRQRPPRKKSQSIDALRFPFALITEAVIVQATGMSSATIGRKVHAEEFPPPRKIGPFKRWVACEITGWLKAQAAGKQWIAHSPQHDAEDSDLNSCVDGSQGCMEPIPATRQPTGKFSPPDFIARRDQKGRRQRGKEGNHGV